MSSAHGSTVCRPLNDSPTTPHFCDISLYNFRNLTFFSEEQQQAEHVNLHKKNSLIVLKIDDGHTMANSTNRAPMGSNTEAHKLKTLFEATK